MSNPTKTEIKLNNVRVVYPAVIEPKAWEKDGVKLKPRYEATFILDKKTHAKEINKINECIDEVLVPFNIKKEKLLLKGYVKLPLRDGELFEKEEYEGAYLLKTSSYFKPVAVGKDVKVKITDPNQFYGGCYVNAIVTIYAYNNSEAGVGVSSNICAIQFVKDGEPIGNEGFDIEGKFESIENEQDDDFNSPF